MKNEQDFVRGVWSSVEEKEQLLLAAQTLFYAKQGKQEWFLKAIIAFTFALGLLIVPLGSAGEGMQIILSSLNG